MGHTISGKEAGDVGGDTVHHTHMLNTLRAFEMNTSAISGACGTQGGWWQLLGDALEHWACSLAHMLSRDMLGTTCGDEEGTVPPEPHFAKSCEFTRDTPCDNENDRLMTDEQKMNS